MNHHNYNLVVKWTGNKGLGTSSYAGYERSHTIFVDNKTDILASSDPKFRGDKTRHNPEELFLASISSCHMLWYLHLCSEAKVVVVDYVDNVTGVMEETADGGGHFTQVILHPEVVVTEDSMIEKSNELHQMANEKCFIANSLNFKVQHNPVCKAINQN